MNETAYFRLCLLSNDTVRGLCDVPAVFSQGSMGGRACSLLRKSAFTCFFQFCFVVGLQDCMRFLGI